MHHHVAHPSRHVDDGLSLDALYASYVAARAALESAERRNLTGPARHARYADYRDAVAALAAARDIARERVA